MTDRPPEEDVRRAVAEVRREGWKATLLVALVEAALAGLVANLAVTFAPLAVLATPVAGSATAGELLAGTAGLAWGLAVLVRHARRSTVERFEAANPEVREALRTARDAVAADRADPVARALYDDVLDRLRRTSSRELVAWRRLVAGVVLVAAVGAGTVAAEEAGVALKATGTGPVDAEPASAGPAGGVVTPSPSGLRDGDEVLGEPTDVSAGDRNLSAEVDSGPGGRGDRNSPLRERPGSDDGTTGVDVRRAGYTSGEEVEDAELVREYTLALEEDEDE